MASDLQKTVAGALLFGASALTGNALLIGFAGGVGVSWSAEGLAGLWQRGAATLAPGTPLAHAGERAIRRAVAELRKAYRKQHGAGTDTAAFDLVAACAGVTAATAPDLAEGSPGLAAQRALAPALAALLHGHDERQAAFLHRELLPATAAAFQAELDADDAAWCGYQGRLLTALSAGQAALAARLERLPEIAALLRDEAGARRALADSSERLEQQLAALREEIARMPARGARPVGEAFVESAVAGEGGSATARNEGGAPPLEPAAISADTLAVRSAIARGPGSQALVENRGALPSAPDPAPAPGRPPALVLTLELDPTATGARVRWRADELGAYTSDFAAPYGGADLAAVLRALEQQQHPAFALADDDPPRLRALGLLDAAGRPVADLARRVGRALFERLASGQGAVALVMARGQAAATARPLALRLLLPPAAVELAALPWELLWPPQGAPLLLSASPGPLLTRHLDLPGPLPPMPQRGGRPLRILALTPHAQRAPGELAEIQAALERLWGDLRARAIAEVETVSPATREDLARAMRHEPDIVQFTGHGWYAEGRGVLMLDPLAPGGPADRVEAGQVAVALRGARMVVLNACRGAQSAGVEAGTAGLLTGVAPALSAAGAPLVVGMQLGVSTSGALRAADAIYSALAQGLSVQGAVGRARDELFVAEGEGGAWYVPTLYVGTRETGPVYL